MEQARPFHAQGFRPDLRHQSCSGGPFAAHTQGGQKAVDSKFPPSVRETRQRRENRINQNCYDQGPRTSQVVCQNSEEDASQRPAHNENGEDDPAIPSNVLGRTVSPQKFFERRRHHLGVNQRVHGIEDPTKPCHEQDQPLISCEFFHGEAGFRSVSEGGCPSGQGFIGAFPARQTRSKGF